MLHVLSGAEGLVTGIERIPVVDQTQVNSVEGTDVLRAAQRCLFVHRALHASHCMTHE